MSEPIQAPPAPTGQAATPPPTPEQVPPAQLTPTANAPVNPTSPPNPASQAQPNPELDALRKQTLEAQRKITEQGQELARMKQQRDALAGVIPQATPLDPLAPFIEKLIKKNYDPQQARDLAEMQYEMVKPLIQAQQQSAMALQSTSMVNDVLRQAWSEMPQPFAANPAIMPKIEQILRSDALAGRPIDSQYAINLAIIEEGRSRYANGGQTPVPTAPPPNFSSMFVPPGGYAAPQNTAPAKAPLTPEQEMWSKDIQKTYNLNQKKA